MLTHGTYSSRFPRRRCLIYAINRQRVSTEFFRLPRYFYLRTHSAHKNCRESVGMAGPLVVKVVPVTNERALRLLRYINRRLVLSCIIMYHHGPIFVCLSVPTPLFVQHRRVCAIQKSISSSATCTVVLEINM